MSGICGIVSLDGGVADPADIHAIASILERRGPDGTHLWIDGPIALGHTLLATTPEALVEVLPLSDPETGCTITADVRLDNREELLATLGLETETRTIGDGELILCAYLRWGEDCPKQLLGDFAFAIWDPRSSQLFCARDHMGMRQLTYFHGPGKVFVFATEPGAILAHQNVTVCANQGRIADALDDLEGIDLTSTFFEGVFRLPPAHLMVVSEKILNLRRYWKLQPGPELKLKSHRDYASVFLDVFAEAVRSRLRCAGPMGSMLSGGIDSSSVTAVAAQLLAGSASGPLYTFSAVCPQADECIETRSIRSAMNIPGITPQSVNHGDLGNLQEELRRQLDDADPFDAHMTLIRALYLSAHRSGIKVMLDGVSGDVVLHSGNRVAQLLRRGRFLRAVREARGEERFWGGSWSASRAILFSAWAAFVPRWARSARRRLKARLADRRTYAGRDLIAADFARAIDLKSRRWQFRVHSGSGPPFGRTHRTEAILHPHLVAARERYDRVASRLAIEPRDPFLDIRVVALCLSLPESQIQSGGWTKLVLRRAMHGLVPDDVVWRRGKEHLGSAFTRSLLHNWERQNGHRIQGMNDRFINADTPAAARTMDNDAWIKLASLSSFVRRHM